MSTPFLILFICLNLSNLFLTSLSSPYNKSSILSSCHKDDHNALINFKESFTFEQPDQYSLYNNATRSWKIDTDCCQWEGIRCHPHSHRVIVVNLFNNGIKATISSNSTLFQLYYLQSLDLSWNDFSESTISPKFGHFRFLKLLNLSNSYFSGRVPLELAQLSKLTSLDLSDYGLQIQNSNTIFHNLTSLRFLNLDETHLDSRFLQSITNLSLLTELHLYDCNLQGELPPFIFNLPHLKILDLGSNEVIKFPSSTNNCSSPLEILYLYHNNISTNFPPFIGQLNHLRSLDVTYCSYSNATRSWKNDTDCCQWEGIRCHLDSHRVIVVNLDSNGIKATISSNSTLFQLYHLQSLDLSSNDFSESTISPKFGQFRFLKLLDLSFSNFSGRVPLELAQLSKLTFLDLSFNHNLQIKNSIKIFHNLTTLRILNLGNIQLDSRFLQSITNLSLLTELFLWGCKLQGELPPAIFNLPHLKSLDLSLNKGIHVKFPSSPYNCSSSLEILNLISTNTSSNFLHFIGQLKHLRALDISYCSLSGTVPISVWNTSESINLRGNELTGGIPSSMNTTKFSSLTNLVLSSNYFVGEIPNWLFNLKLLEYIDLSSNNFSGGISLHTIFSSLPNLINIYLSSSGLSVAIIDSPITMPNQLKTLDLSNTYIEGEFPKWLQKLLRDFSISFDLSYNSLSGVLERLPWGDSDIIDISNNMLTGYLPMVSSPYTIGFYASNNKFIGPIHSSICNSTSLQGLDLSNNNLSGSFPNCLGNLSRDLIMLNLGFNKISGTLPISFSKCGSLEYLDLGSNQLHGQLPRSLEQCSKLNVINLKNNNFTDEFPSLLHTLPNIQVLDLSSNNFHGRITNVNEEHLFLHLQIVDLSKNNLSGLIPITYIKNFKAMMQVYKVVGSPQYRDYGVYGDHYYKIVLAYKGHETMFEKIISTFSYLDLSNNVFEGEIPKCIGELISINGLNLSHNRLTGRIPKSISMLSHLESLDISSNLLSGHIPQELVALTFLEVFNVSDNKLEGLIPEGNNFNTYSADSYMGNLGLCGTPLPECGGGHEPSPNNIESSEDGELSMWEIIVMGFASGVVVGFVWGYSMLSVGKPFWFIRLANTFESALIDFCDKHFGRRG